MRDAIQKYLASKTNAWSPVTLTKETYRLTSLAHAIDGNAETLWMELQRLAPYSRQTAWTRVTAFWAESFPGQENPYETFRTKNANYFKHAYQRKAVPLTYDEAKERIDSIADLAIKSRALTLMQTAQRYCESVQASDIGSVVGKGGKLRADLRGATDDFTGTYHQFWKALKKATGLTPHMLRKLALTRAAENGAQAQDLMEIAGWSSIVTAGRYLQPKRVEKLKEFLK